MKSSVMLTVTSLISILLLALHISEDIVLGFAPGVEEASPSAAAIAHTSSVTAPHAESTTAPE